MKNSKLRFIAILTVIAVVITSLGIGTFVFADTVPEPVVVNNGTGNGTNTFGWINSDYYKSGTVDNSSSDGKALSLTAVDDMTKANVFGLKADTTSAPDVKNVKAISVYVELPDANKAGNTNAFFSFYINAQQYGLKGQRYAIGADGNVIEDFSKLSNFKGTILILIPDETQNTFTPTWGDNGGGPYTWTQFINKYGMTSFGFYLDYDYSIKGQTMVFDELTLYYDAEEALAECKLSIDPPKASIPGGIVQKNTEITLNGEEGSEIYYTTDGTQPDNTSTKYSAEAKPKITENCTLKAVAYKDGYESLTISVDYELYDETLPNVAVLNPFDDLSTASNGSAHEGINVEKTLVDTLSPYGNAMFYKGIGGNGGASMMGVQMVNNMDVDLLAAQEAIAFWVSAPAGFNNSLGACINREVNTFKGTIGLYNTTTGIYEEFKEAPKLDNFEGFYILKLDGECVRDNWGDTSRSTWREYLASTGFWCVTFYQSHAAYYNKTFTMDHMIAIADFETFIADLNKQPKRPMPPTADPGSDAVPMDTQVFLYAGDTCSIYYTTDGTTPVVEDGVLKNGIKYETFSMGNGQEDASYIELKKATTIKAIAVNSSNVVSGMATYEYTIEPPYDGPNVVVVNNGTGKGNNTWSWLSGTYFEKSIVDNDSPDGKGMAIKTLSNKRIVQEITFKVDTEGVEQIHNISGYSFHVDVPDLGNDSYKMYFGLRASGNSNYVKAEIIAISDDGETVLRAKNGINISNFKGTVYCVLNAGNTVSMKYGSVDTTWYKFIKANNLTQFGFYYTRNEIPDTEKYDHTFVIDEFSLIYDTDKLFEEIGLDGLLATYDAGTFENTNMIVTNDGSGNAKNAGLSGFSEKLIIEKSDHSFDERSLKLTMPEGESYIDFTSSSKAEELVIGAGTAFWVEMPKGVGDTTLDLALTDNSTDGIEYWEYGDKWYYLIDKYGVISKKTGELVIPDGFRGWVVVPKENMFIVEKDGFVIANAELDYNQVLDVKVTFCNKSGELTGKTVYIDDISFYSSFADLVRSRALKWEGQVFE